MLVAGLGTTCRHSLGGKRAVQEVAWAAGVNKSLRAPKTRDSPCLYNLTASISPYLDLDLQGFDPEQHAT